MDGHNEAFARFVAYSGPYFFWGIVSLLSGVILWLQ